MVATFGDHRATLGLGVAPSFARIARRGGSGGGVSSTCRIQLSSSAPRGVTVVKEGSSPLLVGVGRFSFRPPACESEKKKKDVGISAVTRPGVLCHKRVRVKLAVLGGLGSDHNGGVTR